MLVAETASAFSGAGSGTEADPYIITDVNQLQEMQGGLNAWYKLDNDVNAYDTVNWNGGAGFLPVGDLAYGFAGHLKGEGYTIAQLYIKRSSSDMVGLFGNIVNGATVENVILTDPNITGRNQTGSLIGNSTASSITSCRSSGAFVSGVTYIGGLVGFSNNSTLTDCTSSSAVVNGSGTDVGGLVGTKQNGGTMVGCWVDQPTVTSTNDNCGGLLGSQSGGSVINCRSYEAVVNGRNYIGGLVGYISGANINDSLSDRASVTGQQNCGGLVGHWSGNGNLTNSHSNGTSSTITGTSKVGGLSYLE